MFKVVYVLADNNKLLYYNQMMKSLTSLRSYMPDYNVCVVMDNQTYNILMQTKAEVFKMAEVLCVQVCEDYSQVEKSRFLKTTLRQRLSGDLLFIDTDTVICGVLPEITTDKSIGLVLEYHMLRNESNWYLTDLYDELSGLNLENYAFFYNSGVIWSRDDEHAHRIYKKWHDLWEQTRKNGTERDQSPLNYIIRDEIEHIETLPGEWNCQFARTFSTGINYLSNALIIHYFNAQPNVYMLCWDEYKNMAYNDPTMIEMLKRPKSLFGKGRMVLLDKENCADSTGFFEIIPKNVKYQYRILARINTNRVVSRILEWCIQKVFVIIKKRKF